MANAVEFLVTLDFQHPLQAQSCWSISKGLIFFMLLPTLFTCFLCLMTVLMTKQAKVTYTFLLLFSLCPWCTDF